MRIIKKKEMNTEKGKRLNLEIISPFLIEVVPVLEELHNNHQK